VDPSTGEVTTLAGNGQAGALGDGGPAVQARLRGPLGVAVGPDGAVYVADSDNHAIRRIDLETGQIDTVVGALGEEGEEEDGSWPEDARLAWPNDVAFAPDGSMLIVDTLHDRVRRVLGFLTP
jgi:streptogramin lyase